MNSTKYFFSCYNVYSNKFKLKKSHLITFEENVFFQTSVVSSRGLKNC